MPVGGCPLGTKDSQAGSGMSRQDLLAAACASQAVPDTPLLSSPTARSQPGGVSWGSGLHWTARLHVGKCHSLLAKGRAGEQPDCSGQSCPELTMGINALVISPNVHASRSCCGFECKLLGRRWRTWEEGSRRCQRGTPLRRPASGRVTNGLLHFTKDLWSGRDWSKVDEARPSAPGMVRPGPGVAQRPLSRPERLVGSWSSPALCWLPDGSLPSTLIPEHPQ